jgi:endonuclease-8
MPEGDTVYHTAAKLRDGLVGKVLTRCDVRVPRFATTDLTGHTVDEVLSRGKHLFIRVGPASVHSHLKMDGSWRVSVDEPLARRASAVDEPLARRAKNRRVRENDYRVRIILEAGSVQAAGVDLGQLEILPRVDDMSTVAHLGPDLLGTDWDAGTAAANLIADQDRPISVVLLDQRTMAGVGNVYCNELCFVSGLLPTAPVRNVADPLRLVSRAHDMLMANRSRWSRTTTGDLRHGRELWVYGRASKPCRRCGTLIETDWAGERVTYWCPRCQR